MSPKNRMIWLLPSRDLAPNKTPQSSPYNEEEEELKFQANAFIVASTTSCSAI